MNFAFENLKGTTLKLAPKKIIAAEFARFSSRIHNTGCVVCFGGCGFEVLAGLKLGSPVLFFRVDEIYAEETGFFYRVG